MPALLRHLRGDLLVVLVFSSVFGLSALAQTATTQVPAGSIAAIAPAKGASPKVAATTPQGKMLTSALTPETRKTLQDAMDSAPAPK